MSAISSLRYFHWLGRLVVSLPSFIWIGIACIVDDGSDDYVACDSSFANGQCQLPWSIICTMYPDAEISSCGNCNVFIYRLICPVIMTASLAKCWARRLVKLTEVIFVYMFCRQSLTLNAIAFAVIVQLWVSLSSHMAALCQLSKCTYMYNRVRRLSKWYQTWLHGTPVVFPVVTAHNPHNFSPQLILSTSTHHAACPEGGHANLKTANLQPWVIDVENDT